MSQPRVWNPPDRRVVRWALWLAAGIAFGVLAGFAAGLSQPRDESRSAGPSPDAAGRQGGVAEEPAR